MCKMTHICVALLIWIMPVPVAAQGAAVPGDAQAERHQKLVIAAEKEGAFNLYTSIAEKDVRPVIAPFEQSYRIKVNVWRAGNEKVLQRTLAEAAAGRHQVDAIHAPSAQMEALHREKILQRVESPYFGDLIAGALPAHREWVASLLSVWVQAYNTELIKRNELPKTYQDLLHPRWKGKLGVEAKDEEWFSTVVLDMGKERGLRLFREIVATNGISVRQGHTLLTNLVVSGEVPLALTVYDYMAEQAKRKGAPIDWIALDPVVAKANGIGIARKAPHPNAAFLFYEYMLSPRTQTLLASMNYFPTSARAPSPLKGLRIKLVDPAIALDEMESWTRLFDEVFVKRTGP